VLFIPLDDQITDIGSRLNYNWKCAYKLTDNINLGGDDADDLNTKGKALPQPSYGKGAR